MCGTHTHTYTHTHTHTHIHTQKDARKEANIDSENRTLKKMINQLYQNTEWKIPETNQRGPDRSQDSYKVRIGSRRAE
jgi:hypothetical protein